MTVDIANTQYLMQDIVPLMEEERALTSNGANVVFLKDSISVNLQSIDVSSSPTPTQSTDNSVVTAPVSANVGNSVGSGTAVLHVDFEHLALGAYKESDVRSDFRVNSKYKFETLHGPDWNAVDIVNDPANTGRGHVMRVLQKAGRGGAGPNEGGIRWRADLPAANAYYFAYDVYFPANWWQPLQFKMPGLINGTMLEASHPGGVIPDTSSLVAFTGIMQSHSNPAFRRGDGSLAVYTYDKDRVQSYDWLNEISPTTANGSGAAKSGQYRTPKGQWIRVEQYMQVNTGGSKNGIMRIWINGKLMSDVPHRWRDASSTRLVDGIWMLTYYGGNGNDPRNQPPTDQYTYYDNFIVSDSPITH